MGDTETTVKPIQYDFVETVKGAIAQRERAFDLTRRAAERGVDNVFFVGCGGSLCAAYPVQFLVDTVAGNLSVFQYTSSEFNFRQPRQLGSRSVVVVGSHTGTTKETVAAISTARNAGAVVFGVTRDPHSPLALAVDEAFTYGSELTVVPSKQILFANIAHGLIQATGTQEDNDLLTAAYNALPEALLQAMIEQETRSHEIADSLKDERVIYVLGSGPNEGVARSLSMCYLQEMQWIHSGAFNSGEFFHGAFEVINEDVPVILFAGEDSTRPMAERALDFLNKYTEKVHFIDSKTLSLPDVPAEARAEIAPIALGSVVTRLAKHFEAVTGHDLTLRRYMGKVEY
jgi:fructoselysine-6-phosphate deglycase